MHAVNRMGCMRAARSPVITLCCAVATHPTNCLVLCAANLHASAPTLSIDTGSAPAMRPSPAQTEAGT